jgi:hypothetical protein
MLRLRLCAAKDLESLGLLFAAVAEGEPDQKAVLARAEQRGLQMKSELLTRLAPYLRAQVLFDRLRQDLGKPGSAGQALTKLEKAFGGLAVEDQELLRQCLPAVLLGLCQEGHFLGEVLSGKAEPVAGGKLRLSYTFDSDRELADWLAVDRTSGVFPFDGREAAGGVTVKDGFLHAESGCILRHRLEFAGDVAVNFLPMLRVDGSTLYISYEPAVGIAGRPGGRVLLANAIGLEERRNGRIAKHDAIGEDRSAMHEGVQSATGLVLERVGTKVRLLGRGKELLSRDARDLPDSGAIMLVAIDRWVTDAMAMDRILIQGVPTMASLQAVMGPWLARVTARF